MESLTNEEESESRLYISGLPHKPVKLGKGIRELRHGEVFALAYLDVAFGEDKSRKHNGHAAQKVSIINRIALNILKYEPKKRRVKGKRLYAGSNNDHLLKIIKNQMRLS